MNRLSITGGAIGLALIAALAVAMLLSSATCVDDTGMYREHSRGPGWKQQEHGDPLLGPGPKNPNGKDNRPGAR